MFFDEAIPAKCLIRLQTVSEIGANFIGFRVVDRGFTNRSSNRCGVVRVFEFIFSRENSPETEKFR